MLMFYVAQEGLWSSYKRFVDAMIESDDIRQFVKNGFSSDEFQKLIDAGVVTKHEDGSYTISDANRHAFEALVSDDDQVFIVESMDPEESYIGINGEGTECGDRIPAQMFFDKKDADEYFAIPCVAPVPNVDFGIIDPHDFDDYDW